MEFIKVSGFKGMIFVPERQLRQLKKYDCRDCFSCQMCGEDRCRACRQKKISGQKKKNLVHPVSN